MKNTLMKADSYKGEHFNWANPDIAFSTGYLEPRIHGERIQVAGLSRLAAQLVLEHRVSAFDIEEFVPFAESHSFGQAKVNKEGFKRIVEEFDGYLPVEVKGLKEGLVIPSRVPVMQVRNTVAGTAWVIPYFEYLWLHVWKTMDVATNSFKQKELLVKVARDTMPADVFQNWIPFALHDFGGRSTGSLEEAEVGIGHLLNFKGSDNWPATRAAQETYLGEFPSYSVLALEHNVMLGHGEANEHALFAEFAEYVLTQGRIGSMLIDTYDVDAAVQWVIDNKERLAEWAEIGGFQGRLVLRPDSGDPTDMPVGILKKLLDNFDYIEYNGYKLLPSWLGVIQGDGNNYERLGKTLNALVAEKISLANIVFGEGGELINNYARDDNQWAFKLSTNTMFDGTEVGCAKKPKHSPEKHSKEGYFSFVEGKSVPAESWDSIEGYVTYYKQGTVIQPTSLDEARLRANRSLL